MIQFEKLRYKNFLSSGNHFTEILLNKHSTTLIVGKNGHGKTTMIDAIMFALFGKPFRNINKKQIINSINGKDCLVEICFTIGSNTYKVIRGIKPNIFEIYLNDVLMNQDAASKDYQEVLEKNILRCNYKSATQVIVLGSTNYIPFMRLPAGDRRAVVEELLDINIFSQMNKIAKDKLTIAKDELKDVTSKINSCKEKMDLHKSHMEAMSRNNEAIIQTKRQDIEDNNKHIDNFRNEITKLTQENNSLKPDSETEEKLAIKLKRLETIRNGITINISKTEQDIEFYDNHSVCAACQQNLHNKYEMKEKCLVRLSELRPALKNIDDDLEKINVELSVIDNLKSKIVDNTTTIFKYRIDIENRQSYIQTLEKEIEKLSNSELTKTSVEKAKELYNDYVALVENRKSLVNTIADLETAQLLLKDDGVKAKIVKQYIPIINKLMNKYLADLNFFVNFTLDEEFKESIKSRHRDIFTYDNFSEGEKARLNLALLFTWRDIARLKNSITTNLLVLDEVFDGALDVAGIEELTGVLGSQIDTNIFIISHKTDQMADKFKHVIRFQKSNGFSVMKED